MRITRVILHHWKGIENYVLEDIDPGLNLILGDNETGKSRIAEAIWFGLFESSKGKSTHKEALRSWEQTGDPKVEIDFETGGSTYHIEKTFGQTGHKTKLTGPGFTLPDDDAEMELASLLGITAPSSRQVKDEELGMWPLLWVRQFRSGEEPHKSLTEDAKARLQDLLSATVGEVAAGRVGQKLMEMALEERGKYYTDTGRSRSPLTEADDRVEDIEEQLNEASNNRRQLEQSAEDLRRVREDITRLDERTLQTSSDLEQAKKKATQAQSLKNQIQVQKGEAAVVEGKLKAVEGDLETRREREDSLKAVQQDAENTRKNEVAPKIKEQDRLDKEVKAAQTALEKATDERNKAREMARRAFEQKKRKDFDERIDQLAGQLKKAKGFQKDILKIAGEIGAIRVDRGTLDTLRELQSQLKSAQDTLLGASTRLRVSAMQELKIDGKKLGKGETLDKVYSEPASLIIDKIAKLEVTPGGENLESLREEAVRLDEQLKNILEAHLLKNLNAAEAAFAEKDELTKKKTILESTLTGMCPEGITTLETALRGMESERKALGDNDPDAPEEKEITLKLETLENAEAEAREARDVVKEELSRVVNELGIFAERVKRFEGQATELQGLLKKMPPAEEIQKAEGDARTAWETALATVKGLEGQYEELGGEVAESDAERLDKVLKGIREDLDEMRQQRARLDANVKLLADKDIHEKEQDLQAKLVEAQKEQGDVYRKAAAAKNLADTLQECRAASQRRLLAPATDAIRKHLQVLFPGIDVSLDEELNVEGLKTATRTEELVDLSGGTKEQIGMIVRLGLAELLAGEEGLPMVFDDALTNTDFRRIEQMHRILFKVADNLQIFIFSCHPEAFEGIGAGKRYRLPGRPARRPIN